MPISLEDPALARRAAEAVERAGWTALTLDDLARALGVSRVTLYRQGITKGDILGALRDFVGRAYQDALWPAITDGGDGRARLTLALRALCSVSERHLNLLHALPDDERDTVFHEDGAEALSRAEVTGGLTRLLRDGIDDGTLVVRESPEETATLLVNFIGWTYRHMRIGHRWSPEHAERAVVDFAIRGVSP